MLYNECNKEFKKEEKLTKYNVEPLRTQNEIDDFLFCLRRTKFSKRDTFMFLFGINTGLRMSDIVQLKVGQIKDNPRPIITEQKTGKKKRLFLDSIQDIVQEYTLGMKDDEWLFPSQKGGHLTVSAVYKQYRKVAQQLGRKDIGTHTVRKTYGYWFYKKTHDIATLMVLFNHSNEAITKRYIGITDDEIGSSLKGFKIGY